MAWTCEACTFSNTSNSAIKCSICETPREDAAELVGKSNKIPSRAIVEPPKSTVQATLFGGIAPKPDNPKPKKRKAGETVGDANAQAILPFAKKPSHNSSAKNGGLACFECAGRDVTFKELKIRTKLAMETVFCVEKLRFLQPKAVSAALKRKSQLVVMATGGGKSLCYQLPAVVLGGLTVVVSPLIALMQNQVSGLTEKGVEAAVISSAEGDAHNTEVLGRMLGRSLLKKIKKGQTFKHLTLVYVTPEQVTTKRFRDILAELYKKKRLALFAVDEAHCLSSWGHDFRKSYMKLDYLREAYPDVPLIACTATATPKVMLDIKKTLRLEDSPCYIGSFDRPNLFYKVKYKDSLDATSVAGAPGDIGGAAGDLVRFIKKQHERCKKKGVKCNGIVYVHKREQTQEIAFKIRKGTGVKTVAYHGGLKAGERSAAQESWTSGDSPIAVATLAFGMGIDLAHVRYVAHFTVPKSPESFYQESGRAGRDGLPAFSLLYYSKSDASKFQYLLSLKKDKAKDKGTQTEREMESLEAMVDYCTIPGCRRYRLLKHFGEPMDDAKQICGRTCDFCVNPERVQRAIEAASCVLDHQFHTRQPLSKDPPHIRNPVDDDDSVTQELDASWSASALDIMGNNSGATYDENFSDKKPSANFESARSVLSKYEEIESKAPGFIHYREKKAGDRMCIEEKPDGEKTNDRVRIPQHLILKRSASLGQTKKPVLEVKKSTDYAEDTARLQDELAKTTAASIALQQKKQTTKLKRRPPPPPPTLSFASKNRRR